MPLRISTARRNAAVDTVVDAIDAGASAGYLEVRTGSQPANPQAAATGTLLATLTFSDPAFLNPSVTGVATADTITSDTNVDNTGTAGWFRIYDSDNLAIMDGDVGQGSGTLSFDNTAFIAGGTASISSLTVTMPE